MSIYMFVFVFIFKFTFLYLLALIVKYWCIDLFIHIHILNYIPWRSTYHITHPHTCDVGMCKFWSMLKYVDPPSPFLHGDRSNLRHLTSSRFLLGQCPPGRVLGGWKLHISHWHLQGLVLLMFHLDHAKIWCHHVSFERTILEGIPHVHSDQPRLDI